MDLKPCITLAVRSLPLQRAETGLQLLHLIHNNPFSLILLPPHHEEGAVTPPLQAQELGSAGMRPLTHLLAFQNCRAQVSSSLP